MNEPSQRLASSHLRRPPERLVYRFVHLTFAAQGGAGEPCATYARILTIWPVVLVEEADDDVDDELAVEVELELEFESPSLS